MSSSVFSALKRFTSCDIGDALVKLKVPYGGYCHGLSMFSPHYSSAGKIFGPVYTVKMVDAKNKAAPQPDKHFADCIPKGSVVFVSQPKGLFSACWGGLMSTRAKILGAEGVVVDGNFRDLLEHRELGMPLFARGKSSLGSNSFTRSSELNVPIEYNLPEQEQPLVINPGDWVVADVDGVVVIPPSLAEECLKLCQERFAIDEKTKEALEQGAEMGPTIARLRK
ncbi:uncharacterized protein MYCFIDRAFT_210515 [Pseudocercospora fijiensis CIRAD86]|uniref:Uncharacterized protein n=1 Tax=Pseudocercospora fijiensis (strain CIRAD86) TaxID=383855 RepID=M2Z9J0_PSEFD|nr:uncharacterized protein MYCFIDRAFT_210515 [Pseudocercospora fijiensis CIRAD86]EME86510.1 hypothetical protein MYCFIDRAFT_210515 [Pseudocercospora fijiensis CIRAD86]